MAVVHVHADQDGKALGRMNEFLKLGPEATHDDGLARLQ